MAGLILPVKGSDFIRGGSKQIPRVGEAGGLAMPAIPSLNFASGTSGNLTLQSSTIRLTKTDSVIISQYYTWNPVAAGGYTFFNFSIPNGWILAGIVSAFFPASNAIGNGGAAIEQGIDVAIANAASAGNVLYCLLEITKL